MSIPKTFVAGLVSTAAMSLLTVLLRLELLGTLVCLVPVVALNTVALTTELRIRRAQEGRNR